MKTRISRHYRLTILATVAALGAFTPALYAQWSSLRSNNHPEHGHEAEPGHPAPERGRPPVEHRAVVVEHGHPAPVHVAEPRHWDVEPERHGAFWWGTYHPGVTIGTLPQGYVQVSVGGTGYYYYNGVYFRPTPAGPYAVVGPPMGAIVPQVPEGAEMVNVAGATYYYAAGAFYLSVPGGFAVAPAPLGAVVHEPPPGATPVASEGKIYYFGNGVYYLPMMAGGVTVYAIVMPPSR
jgi:hypothetical protein